MLREALEQAGAHVIECAVIQFVDPLDWHPVDEAIARLEEYRWLIFTSANAVERFLHRLVACDREPRHLAGHKLACIGPVTTRRLAAHGLNADAIPIIHKAEELAQCLIDQGVGGRRILIPRAEKAREFLPRRLREAGAEVDVVAVYRTVPSPVPTDLVERIEQGRLNLITFTSASTVVNLIDGLGSADALRDIDLAAIGPVTAGALKERGLTPLVVPTRATIDALVEAIVEHYEGK